MALKRRFLCCGSSGKAGNIGKAEITRAMFNGSFGSYCLYIRPLFFNFTIRKYDLALKITLLVPLLKGKSSEVQNMYYCNS